MASCTWEEIRLVEVTDTPLSGGLGPTGGIADVGSLFDCLYGIHKGVADDSILEKYAEIRRKIYREIIDISSRENFRRLSGQDADTAGEKDPLFQLCKKAETDKNLAIELGLVSGNDSLAKVKCETDVVPGPEHPSTRFHAILHQADYNARYKNRLT